MSIDFYKVIRYTFNIREKLFSDVDLVYRCSSYRV